MNAKFGKLSIRCAEVMWLWLALCLLITMVMTLSSNLIDILLKFDNLIITLLPLTGLVVSILSMRRREKPKHYGFIGLLLNLLNTFVGWGLFYIRCTARC